MDERTLAAIYALLQNVELAVRQAFDVPFGLPTCPECGGFLSVAPDRGGLICTKCGAEFTLALKAERPAKPAEARGGAPREVQTPSGPTTREGQEGSITPFILELDEPAAIRRDEEGKVRGPVGWLYGRLDEYAAKRDFDWRPGVEDGKLVRLEFSRPLEDEELRRVKRWLDWAVKRSRGG